MWATRRSRSLCSSARSSRNLQSCLTHVYVHLLRLVLAAAAVANGWMLAADTMCAASFRRRAAPFVALLRARAAVGAREALVARREVAARRAGERRGGRVALAWGILSEAGRLTPRSWSLAGAERAHACRGVQVSGRTDDLDGSRRRASLSRRLSAVTARPTIRECETGKL